MTENNNPRKAKASKFIIGGVLQIVIPLLLVVIVALLRVHRLEAERIEKKRDYSRGPLVEVVEAKPAPSFREVRLIGETRPFFESILYAKVSGYLKKINVDKGDTVKAGDLLAVIESPETDKAYISAYADYYNKHRIAQRYKVLLRKKLVSQQEADGVFANDDISKAYLQTQQVLKDYERIVAPFNGFVTARFVDPGALIQNSQGSQSGSQAVVTVSELDRLRIFSYVDQKDAPFVKGGVPVKIRSTAPAGSEVSANITRTAGSLDARTRTLLAEVDFDNRDGKFVAGSFVEVDINVPTAPAVEVPARSLVLQGSKSLIPVVDEQSHVHFQPVDVAGNDGKVLRITSGLKAGERVAVSLGNTVNDGDVIQPRETQAAGKAPVVQSQN